MKKYKLLFLHLTAPCYLMLALAALCSLFPASLYSQWLETTIYVPDSLCGIINPQVFTYNATNNKIYVGGEYGDCLIVIDGLTNQKIAKIPAGSSIKALCYNSTDNKVYCANYWSNNLTVIDGSNDNVIITIPTGSRPRALVWNSTTTRFIPLIMIAITSQLLMGRITL
jgi:YVTN family beta-propeller protein